MANENRIVDRDSWRAVVMSRVEVLEAELAALPARRGRDDATVERITKLLDDARGAAASRSRTPRAWWTGSTIERAWRSVHAVEVLLAAEQPIELIQARYPALLASARHMIRTGDPRRAAIHRWLGQSAQAGSVAATVERARYATCLQWIKAESDDAYSRVRSFRNLLIVVACAMSIVAVGFVVVGAFAPDAIPVCVEVAASDDIVADQRPEARICPTGGSVPSGGDVPLVAFVGFVGAALASAVAIRKMRGTQTPYSVPLAMALLKLPTGAVTATAGLVLIQGDFVPGLSALDTQAQVISYAIILGFAQEAFTRLVDRQGEQVLTNAPGPDQMTPELEQPEPAEAPIEPSVSRPSDATDEPSDRPHDEPPEPDEPSSPPTG